MIIIIVFAVSVACAILTALKIGFDNPFVFTLVVLGFIICYAILQLVLFLLFNLLPGLFVNRKKEFFHYSKIYRFILFIDMKVCMSLFNIKIDKIGFEKVPSNTNFVVTYNHISNFDSMLIDVILAKRPLVFVAKTSLFNLPFFGNIIRGLGYLNLGRGNLRKEIKTISHGISLLKNNECSVGVAPEGTRNFTSEILLPFKPGCFNLAKKSGKPIVITAVKGTEKVKYHKFFRINRVSVEVLKVLTYDEIKDLTTIEISNIVYDITYNAMKNYDKRIGKK